MKVKMNFPEIKQACLITPFRLSQSKNMLKLFILKILCLRDREREKKVFNLKRLGMGIKSDPFSGADVIFCQ